MTKPKQKRHTPLLRSSVNASTCSTERRLELLHRVPLFRRLSLEQIAEVNSRFRAEHYAAAESIYHAGEPARELCVLVSGNVKLLRYSPAGQEVLLELLAPGEAFGSLAALGDEQYQDSAVAQTPCCILLLPQSAFEGVLEAFPAVTRAALELTAARLRESRETVRQLSLLPLEQRLAATLLKLGEKLGERHAEGLLLQVPLAQQDLAAMTGSTLETVNRVLRQFRLLGLLKTGRQWLILIDTAELKNIAEGRLSALR